MTNSLFEQNSEPTSSPQAEPNQPATSEAGNVFDDKLKAITTEDGKQKYDTVDKALDALGNAQAHIPKLEQENAQLRDHLQQIMGKMEKVTQLEEVVERLNTTSQQNSEPQGSMLSEDDLSDHVNQILDKRSQADALQKNEMTVSQQMRDKYGDKAVEVIQRKASDMGVTVEYLQNTARTSPKMFMSLFGESPKKEPQVTTSNQNSLAVPQPTTTAPRSLMAGASTKDLLHEMAALKQEVMDKYKL
jgi:hypothetical protein